MPCQPCDSPYLHLSLLPTTQPWLSLGPLLSHSYNSTPLKLTMAGHLPMVPRRPYQTLKPHPSPLYINWYSPRNQRGALTTPNPKITIQSRLLHPLSRVPRPENVLPVAASVLPFSPSRRKKLHPLLFFPKIPNPRKSSSTTSISKTFSFLQHPDAPFLLPLTGTTLGGHHGVGRDPHGCLFHGHQGKGGGLPGPFQDVAIAGRRHQGGIEDIKEAQRALGL